MTWEFAAILLGALVLTGATSWWQTRRFAQGINDMATRHRAEGRHLVTGRCKGRTKGAVVALVVDAASNQVVAAKKMTGATALAHLKPAEELVGPLETVTQRAGDKVTSAAVEDALARLQQLLSRRRTVSAVPGVQPAR